MPSKNLAALGVKLPKKLEKLKLTVADMRALDRAIMKAKRSAGGTASLCTCCCCA